MRGIAAAVLAATWSGCAPRILGNTSPGVGEPGGPAIFAPVSRGAARYNDMVEPPPPSDLGNVIVAAIRDITTLANAPMPTVDARLFRACADLAQVVPENGMPPYSLVEFALQHQGIIEPSPELLVVWGDIASAQRIVDQLRPLLWQSFRAGSTTRVGVGSATRGPNNYGVAVLAILSSSVATTSIARTIEARGSVDFEAKVDKPYHDPRVKVMLQDGSVAHVRLQPKDHGAFTVQIDCGTAIGKQVASIEGSSSTGTTVLANFPVWCGEQPPRSLTIAPWRDDPPVADVPEAERRLFSLINRDRQKAALPQLLWDDVAASVARHHSNAMRNTKIVAQNLPATGRLHDRVRMVRHNVIVHTNVATAYSLMETHWGLMDTPGTREHVLSSSATHLGIGVAFGGEGDQRAMYITQVFTYARPRLDIPKAAEHLRELITMTHPVASNPELDAIACEMAGQIASGSSAEQAFALVKPRVAALSKRYARIGTANMEIVDLDDVDASSVLGDSKPDEIGIGIAQGTHPRLGENTIFISILNVTRL